MKKKQKAEISAFYDLYKKEKGGKVCNNCTNKKCYIASLPESERKDCKEHHENYEWGIVFDCKNHNKWQGGESE